MAKDRQALMEELSAAVRDFQRGTDELDEVVAGLMRITRADARCIDVLEERGRMTAGELAQSTGLTSGAITGIVDRLEERGYVRRVRDDADRRRVFVELTEAAQQAAQEYYWPLAELSAPFIATLSDADLEVVVRFLRAGHDVTSRQVAHLRSSSQKHPS